MRHRPRRTPASAAAAQVTEEPPSATQPPPPPPPPSQESPAVWWRTCFAMLWTLPVPARANNTRGWVTGLTARVSPGGIRGRERSLGWSVRESCRSGCGGPCRCSKRRFAERIAASLGGCWRRTALCRRRCARRRRCNVRRGRQGGGRANRKFRVCMCCRWRGA